METKCINQLIRPKTSVPEWIRPDGVGDCTKCKPCENNQHCAGYTPVRVGTFTIRRKKKNG